jgi:short-subunit dehydrogenase
MEIEDSVVVVTGAGAGIGRELALEALARGAAGVAAVDRDEGGLRETAARAEGDERLSLHICDITDRGAVEALPDAVIERHGAVDAVVNNAGVIQPFVRLAELGYDDIARMMDVNFYGTVYVTKSFLPHLLERPEAHIANVSSMGGFLPVPGQAVYGASKAAVKLMTEALYAELLDTEVGVSVVMPGAVATDIAANSGVEIAGSDADSGYESMAADRAAQKIIDGIEDDDLHILVGSDARLMSIANRIAPQGSIRLIQRQMKNLLPDDSE